MAIDPIPKRICCHNNPRPVAKERRVKNIEIEQEKKPKDQDKAQPAEQSTQHGFKEKNY